MKSDNDLQIAIEDAIQSEPLLAAEEIAVTVENGIATLFGNVDRFAKKEQAERTTKKVIGIKIVFDKINVKSSSREQKNDLDIKAEVLNAFRWNWNTLNNSIKVKVTNGIVTLTGALEWNYQKEAAKTAVSNLIGVKGVINDIIIASESHIKVSKIVIERALECHNDIDVSDISVAVTGKEITLTGSVETWFQKELAGRIAWKAPGVENVCNDLKITTELMVV